MKIHIKSIRTGSTGSQVRSEHYCSHVNPEVRQCVIYDTPEKNARLIGIECFPSPNSLPCHPPQSCEPPPLCCLCNRMRANRGVGCVLSAYKALCLNLYLACRYIISRRLFEGLPEEEKCMWHSHGHEVPLKPPIPSNFHPRDPNQLHRSLGSTLS